MTDDQKPHDSDNEPSTTAGKSPGRSESVDATQVDPAVMDSGTKPGSSQKAPTVDKTATKPPAGQHSAAYLGLIWVLLIALALALVVGGFYLWQEQQALHSEAVELRNRVERQQGQWDGQSAQLTRSIQRELEQESQVRERALAGLRDELASTSRRLVEMSATSREDWKLAEAEYLLRLASQRLVVERNSTTALAMAQAADRLLRELNDSNLHGVRRALARDINTLKMVEPIDREGLYLRLLALIEQTETLSALAPMGQPLEQGEPVALGRDAEPKSQRWRHRVKASFGRFMTKLNQHLRVRTHRTPAVDVVLPPENQVYLSQNLRLMLEQAQSALLREEQLVYQSSLGRAQEWLAKYYSLNPRAVRLQQELAELQQEPVSQELPSIGEALSLLKTYIEQRHRLGSDASGVEGDA